MKIARILICFLVIFAFAGSLMAVSPPTGKAKTVIKAEKTKSVPYQTAATAEPATVFRDGQTANMILAAKAYGYKRIVFENKRKFGDIKYLPLIRDRPIFT